jgi:hypothetical protein
MTPVANRDRRQQMFRLRPAPPRCALQLRSYHHDWEKLVRLPPNQNLNHCATFHCTSVHHLSCTVRRSWRIPCFALVSAIRARRSFVSALGLHPKVFSTAEGEHIDSSISRVLLIFYRRRRCTLRSLTATSATSYSKGVSSTLQIRTCLRLGFFRRILKETT